VLVEKQRELGNQWVKIKAMLPHRSLVAVKSRWNWLCRRDVPNHGREFAAMVKSRGVPTKDEIPQPIGQRNEFDIFQHSE
jgi:hypothetical protein